MGESTKPTAAFFRVEGTLLSRGALATSAYFAANKQGITERLLGLGQVALAAPLYAVLGQNDRTLANRVAWLALRNMSEDRVLSLSEEYFAEVLQGKVMARGRELLERAREEGHRIVLLSELIAPLAEPLAVRLGHVDRLVCNRLEFRDGVATGKLLDPVVGGYNGGRWAVAWAAENGIDLGRSLAYASHGPDLTLLGVVGKPCAVNPDFTLRSAAKDADWPIVVYEV